MVFDPQCLEVTNLSSSSAYIIRAKFSTATLPMFTTTARGKFLFHLIMDSTFRQPSSPGGALLPVSPERTNRQSIMQSSSFSPTSRLTEKLHSPHRNSDVQFKVAQFNNLNIEASHRRKENEAALKRAILGREEAETESARLRTEHHVLQTKLEEARARERKVAERVESVMVRRHQHINMAKILQEEMQRLKDTQAHSQALYEKEVRRARKEAFKASSSLVNVQEELKHARNRATLLREDVEAHKRKVASKEQETFDAQYQLVGVQEELEMWKGKIDVAGEDTISLMMLQTELELLKDHVKEVEKDRQTLKTQLTEQEKPRTVPSRRPSPESTSTARQRRDSGKENVDPQAMAKVSFDEVITLRAELANEVRWRLRALSTVEFMKLECQFKRCSCRVAEEAGREFVHDNRFSGDVARLIARHRSEIVKLIVENDEEEPLIEFSPSTGTFRTIPSPAQFVQPALLPLEEASPEISRTKSTEDYQAEFKSRNFGPPEVPSTPRVKTTTTTTIIPVALGSPTGPTTAAHIPFSPASTMTREQALEQIRMRRGRARSVVIGENTPKRVLGLKRDISAPTANLTCLQSHRLGK